MRLWLPLHAPHQPQISSRVQLKDKGPDTLICAHSRDQLLCEQRLKNDECWGSDHPVIPCEDSFNDPEMHVFAFQYGPCCKVYTAVYIMQLGLWLVIIDSNDANNTVCISSES